jgi:uncharacterized protein YacL
VIVEAVRLLITLALTAVGFELGPDLAAASPTNPSVDSARVLGAVVGAGVGYVVGGAVGRWFRTGFDRAPERFLPQLSGAELFTGAFGLMVGIAVGAVVAVPLIFLVPATFAWPIAALGVFLISAVSARVFAARSDDLMAAMGLGARRPVVSRRMGGSEAAFLLDSSGAIDGRILELVRTGLVEGRLWVPTVVLDELQRLADSADRTVRRRGRRGLDVLAALESEPGVDVTIMEETVPEVNDVDAKLLELADRAAARLITTDHNLARSAELRGLRVLNPNQIQDAVKATVDVGQRLMIPVTRSGSEPGQGVGYLEDGTMVVIEGGAAHVGEDLDVEVTSTTRTAIGRMLFAKQAS